MKYTLFLQQDLPFANNPRIAELEGEKILCNDVFLPASIDSGSRFNPYTVRLWIIGHEFGPICGVFASCEQDAFDEACDAGLIDCLMIEDPADVNEDSALLGNASEPFDLKYAWIGPVEFEPARDILLITALARAAGSGADTLE